MPKYNYQGNSKNEAFNLWCLDSEGQSPWSLWKEACQQVGRHGSGAVAESLDIDPKAQGRDK